MCLLVLPNDLVRCPVSVGAGGGALEALEALGLWRLWGCGGSGGSGAVEALGL